MKIFRPNAACNGSDEIFKTVLRVIPDNFHIFIEINEPISKLCQLRPKFCKNVLSWQICLWIATLSVE